MVINACMRHYKSLIGDKLDYFKQNAEYERNPVVWRALSSSPLSFHFTG
jgi:hypothetical protein